MTGLLLTMLFGVTSIAWFASSRARGRKNSTTIAWPAPGIGSKLQAEHLYALGLEALRNDQLQRAAQALALAAVRGHPRAQLHYGVMCEHGIGVPLDLERARELYLQASAHGDADAHFRLQVINESLIRAA